MNDTFARVRALLIREFDLELAYITPRTPLTDLGVDSLADLKFEFTLHTEFAIRSTRTSTCVCARWGRSWRTSLPPVRAGAPQDPPWRDAVAADLAPTDALK